MPGHFHGLQFRDFWREELKPPAFIMDAVENGYKIPLTQRPVSGTINRHVTKGISNS